jgi:hypothetical protein
VDLWDIRWTVWDVNHVNARKYELFVWDLEFPEINIYNIII